MTRIVHPAVGGIPIVHEASFDLRFRSWLIHDWRGSRATQPPVYVHHVVGDTNVLNARLVYDGSPWNRIFVDRDGRTLVRFAPIAAHLPEQLLVSERDGHRYELRHRAPPSMPIPQMARDLPLLTLALPARRRGALVHACGFLADGLGGVLCPGVSGAGKSTLARLLVEARAPVTVLSDDRVVLGVAECDTLALWGTPWPGDALASSEQDGPLRAIVFVARGARCALRRVAPVDGAHRLFGVLGIPLWDRALVETALELVDRLMRDVPVFEAAYPPRADSARWLVETLYSEAGHA
jgi:hypothetical protein